ncbi:ABC transporter ATP-binding protein [Paracoccus shanxieyensis]|uniref:ATP-binding cassette domain-containing protein n=1 Tax=Paracoccus shanxieyensis TaxID=2675752 RepID=A0A6L6J1C1_9RHOB|nr:ABC transporter ATP-binding protein [Paracoccus shanxieyensis]MTH65608.1 ATP-binding cassette domain-containing protein [Paracoccus shanxieyensis]MTH88817.1 ATP-binding cassette domain-containing protein [Paracoccus shanxieyensis]
MLEVRSLSHSYAQKPVLRDVSVALRRGRITVLLGPSGCGKTTLLRLVAGLLPLQAGQVMIDGQPPVPGRNTAMLFQDSRLLPWRRVSENLSIQLQSLPARDRPARIAALLQRVGLSDHAQSWPEELSGGQQQRLAMARLLATDAPLLLMDERFAALDGFARERLQDETRHLASEGSGRGILFVTHSIDEALLLGDEVLVLANGSALPQDLHALTERRSDFATLAADRAAILDRMRMHRSGA